MIGAVVAAALLAAMGTETTPTPEVWFHQFQPNPDRVTIQLDAPPRAWGIRRVARQVNAATDAVHIYRYGTCERRPAAWCLRVVKVNEPEAGWVGRYVALETRIELNTAYGQWLPSVGCHEFGHAMGLWHHNRRGCVGLGEARFLSPIEMRVLARHYEGLVAP